MPPGPAKLHTRHTLTTHSLHPHAHISWWLQAHGGDPLIPFSGALEATLLDMPDDEKAAYCKEASAVICG